MKMKGRMMLLLTLIVAVALSAISYKGIGSKKALSVHRIEQGLDLSGGVDIVYEADQKSVTDDEMKAAISLLQGSVDWKGWTEAEVAREGDKRIRVQIPGVEDAEEAIQEIGQTAQLSAYMKPANAERGVTWATSNPNIVRVDNCGKMTAVSTGTALVTAQSIDGS